MLVLVYALIGIAAATTAITLAGFNVDLAIASLFYNPATRRFTGQDLGHWAMLRDHGLVALVTCIGCILLAAAKYLPWYASWRLPSLPTRTAIALTLSLALGPGLLVNVILKEHWDRPRPAAVTQFGGTLAYVDWWNPNGACDRNCSFMSGEAASAAWMFGPAMLVPPPWRAAALAAAALFTAAMSGLRMSVGAHFFTDALFGALSTMLILLAMFALFDRVPAARGSATSSRAQPTA